jgi:DNA-binding response OmpR family regulator
MLTVSAMNPRAKVLVVEDEEPLALLLRYNLEAEGYAVDVVHRGDEAEVAIAESSPDLIVLDWMLPSISGLEVCRQIRRKAETRDVPVIMLTARGEEADRVRGLDSGADDYVVKPVDLDELAARLRALVRRSRGEPAAVLAIGPLRLDPAARSVAFRGEPVVLQAREFNLLQELMLNAGRVLSRDQLAARLYAWGEEVESNAVEVHVHHLRRKLAPEVIRTVRGVGYVLPRDEPGES